MVIYKTNKHKPKFFRHLIKTVVYFIVTFLLLLSILASIFYVYRDKIGENILLKINDLQKGEVSFSEVSLSPFIHFPHMSVKLRDVIYLANPGDKHNSGNDTIGTLQSLYASIDIIDLINGKIDVSRITLEQGEIYLIKYPDSTINLLNAVGVYNNSDSKVNDKNEELTDTLKQDAGLDILLQKVELKDITFKYKDFTKNDSLEIKLENLKASFQYQSDSIQSTVKANIFLPGISLFEKLKIDNNYLQIQLAFLYDQNNEKIEIKPSSLNFEKAKFELAGSVDLKNDFDLDIKIDGSDTDFSFFKLWLSETGLKNLQSGKVYFSGTLKGPVKHNIPQMDFDFGFTDVNLHVPDANESISNLHLEGFFKSGRKNDFSEAQLQIKNLKGKLPGGYINAHLFLEDFVNPRFDILWDLKSNLKGLVKVMNINAIDSLSGEISIYDNTKGYYDPESCKIIETEAESSIIFDSLSMIITGVMNLECLDGELVRKLDTLEIFNLKCITDNSDLLINGTLYNIIYLILGDEKEIIADLNIKSKVFDLPQIFAYYPIVGKSFPYRIIDLDMDVKAISSTSKLLEFDYNPEIEFEIMQMEATIEDLFPPVTLIKGNVLLAEKEERIYMTFKDFDLAMAGSTMNADVEYFSPPINPDFISVEVIVSDLNPARIFYNEDDTISRWVDGNLNGFIKTELEFGLDTLVFEKFDIETGELSYYTNKDTFDISNLNIKANKIYYSTDGKALNPIITLSADAIIKAEKVYSNYFKVEDISYDLKVHSGIFTIKTEHFDFFGKKGEASYIISPFHEVPQYELKLAVKQFKVDEFMTKMLSDTILTGNMDIGLDVSFSGIEKEDIFSSINGTINLTGNDLTLHGFDLDNLIYKYNKSQHFSLVDVGAVLVAGPFGLAITKGSDFANLALGNMGETTNIGSFVSELDIGNGKINLKDVAFSTKNNLVAANGSINLTADSLDATIAVLDKNRCSVLSQSIYGSLNEPQQSEVKIIGTLLGPITNLIEGSIGKDCEPFYVGKLTHPVKDEKE